MFACPRQIPHILTLLSSQDFLSGMLQKASFRVTGLRITPPAACDPAPFSPTVLLRCCGPYIHVVTHGP